MSSSPHPSFSPFPSRSQNAFWPTEQGKVALGRLELEFSQSFKLFLVFLSSVMMTPL